MWLDGLLSSGRVGCGKELNYPGYLGQCMVGRVSYLGRVKLGNYHTHVLYTIPNPNYTLPKPCPFIITYPIHHPTSGTQTGRVLPCASINTTLPWISTYPTLVIYLFEVRKIAVCFLWLSLPGDYWVTDEALLAETT